MPRNDTYLEAYAILSFDDWDGPALYHLTTTYKPYFDAEGCMDDGSSDAMFPGHPYSEISRRLETVGIVESMESVFEFEPSLIGGQKPMDVAERLVAAKAADAGVTLLFGDTPFSRFLASCE